VLLLLLPGSKSVSTLHRCPGNSLCTIASRVELSPLKRNCDSLPSCCLRPECIPFLDHWSIRAQRRHLKAVTSTHLRHYIAPSRLVSLPERISSAALRPPIRPGYTRPFRVPTLAQDPFGRKQETALLRSYRRAVYRQYPVSQRFRRRLERPIRRRQASFFFWGKP
jgi:hypothetical protein